jgi:UDP:flavonoid glycosyltransferase YjiC (YdhE family)
MASSSGDDRQQPHVVLVPSPSRGHTIPFMILAQQIVQHGMRVTFVSSDKHIASLEQAKESEEKKVDMVRFVGLRDGPANFAEAIEEASDQRMAAMLTEWMTTATAMAMANREKQSNSFSDVDDLRSAAPCCIISDMFGGWTHVVAKKFAIPSHVLFTSPAACAAMQLTVLRSFLVQNFRTTAVMHDQWH